MVEARVEYDYDAENADELTLRTGDIITNVVQKDGGWWEGRLKGKQGLFPDNFVKVMTKENKTSSENKSNGISLRRDKKRKCRVVYSYTPVNDDELELEVDTVIDVLEEVEEGWWKGFLNGRVGVFPSNFVEELNNERTGLGGGGVPNVRTSLTDTEIKPKPVRGIGLGNIFQDEVIRLKPAQDSSPERKTNPSPIPKKPAFPSSSSEAPILPPKPVREQAKVLFAYDACNDDELTLREGDIITIISKDVEDKGWWKGELNNRLGVFPDNFVEIISLAESKTIKKSEKIPSTGTESGERISDAPPPIPDHPKRPFTDSVKRDDKPLRPEKRAPPMPGKKPQLPPPMKKPQRFPPPPTSTAVASSEQMTDDMKDELALDSVEATTDKLTHLTASRPRNPHHRPPSHLFMKDTPPVSKEKLSDVLEGDSKPQVDCNSQLKTTLPLHEKPSSVENEVQEILLESDREDKTSPSPVSHDVDLTPFQTQTYPPKDENDGMPPEKPAATLPPPKPVMTSTGTGPIDEGSSSPTPKLKQHYSFSSKAALMMMPKEKDDIVSKLAKLSVEETTTNEVKKELQSLKHKVLELQLMMESHRAQYQDKIRELTHEIDEEKKTRMMMQVELDRLKRQLRDH